MHPGGRTQAPATPAPPGFRLTRLLGRGGMGEVYLADDLRLGRKVAIKFLLDDKLHDESARRRLLREAQAAAALDHPGICTVYETGDTPDGKAYIAMQYVEGEPLSAILQRGPLPVRDALSLCSHIAEALSAAHGQNIVHRDLKPANVMITPSGRPKLLDLGIAKVLAAGPAATEDTSSKTEVTAAGHLVGTAGYMSPEHVQQRALDGRCDLFSLGAVLYECLTGRRAFDGSTTFETLANVLHLHPPPPSRFRPELTEAHDELCRRLLAKDPADRFQSAHEVVGAIRVISPDSSRTDHTGVDARLGEVRPRRLSRRALAVAALALAAAGLAAWLWWRPDSLPPVPQDAARWYEQGADAIREGAYFSGLKALDEAVRQFPDLVLAYARRAEAYAELDDQTAAQEQLLHMTRLVPNESRLPRIERLRLNAVRALVVRDVDSAVALYRQLADLLSEESRAWLDLGRAQEAAGLRLAAAESYRRALQQDRDYAAAHLRLGTVLGLELRRDDALAAFAEAERLYRAASNREGEAEVLLRRGMLYDAMIEPANARRELERARAVVQTSGAVYQQVRIDLALSSVTASEGRSDQAVKLAQAAVQRAIEHGLEMAAAEGLIDLAALLQVGQSELAASQAEQAIRLAQRRGARRTESRARLQLAAIRQYQGRYADSLPLLASEFPFLAANRYRRYELFALGIQSRALQGLDRLDEARRNSADMLAAAEAVQDDAQIALAAANLASVTASLGGYPEALALRERVEEIRTRQGDREALPFDEANRADLLIRLGRRADADRVLAAIDQALAAKTPEYDGQARRAAYLHALSETTSLDCEQVPARVAQLMRDTAARDSASVLAPPLAAVCAARLGRSSRGAAAGLPAAEPALLREVHYWRAVAALEANDPQRAAAEAQAGLERLGRLTNDELRWRLAAAATAAARGRRDGRQAGELRAAARAALDRLRAAWPAADLERYLQRPDLAHLRQLAGL